jgi:hypothetical protein
MTKKTCLVCGTQAVGSVEGVANVEDAVFPGSVTGVQHVGDHCAKHKAEVGLAMKAKAEAQLARDIPIHQDMFRLQNERSLKYRALKNAVVARDEFLAANSTTEYDPKMKMDRLKWSGDARAKQAEYERLHQLVRDADAATDAHEAEWNATVARGSEPVTV